MGLYLDGWVMSLADECLWMKWPYRANAETVVHLPKLVQI